MQISDHGDFDFLTPTPLTDAERAIADAARHALMEQRYQLNLRDRQMQRLREEREEGA